MNKLFLLYNTLRHIKPIQLYWRLYLKVNSYFPFSSVINDPYKDKKKINLLPCIEKYQTLTANNFTFLNASSPFNYPVDWNNSEATLLWLYNLHYFDYLHQGQIDSTVAVDLIQDWICQNKVAEGAGWQPYPVSLRIVNWIKYLSQNTRFEGDIKSVNQSLYIQARYLYKHLEYHLLGNHLFKNGVALLFAGYYFESAEALAWQKKGWRIINEQVKEQVLPDGGHFERSPTYHVLILEDILDCLNLAQGTGLNSDTINLEAVANKMLSFLFDILHQDGGIPLFNDGALNIAPEAEKIFKYADRLGLDTGQFKFPGSRDRNERLSIIEKPGFGIYTLQNKTSKMIVDAGAIGPDYLPGHAHCDTLSYELSIGGYRCIVNSGTYQYFGEFRNYFRSTKAHNTVRINGYEQHEIWSTFRVARRGYPFDVKVYKTLKELSFSASHSGYKRIQGTPVHTRQIDCFENGWKIEDTVTGDGEFIAESFIHLHPEVEILEQLKTRVKCKIKECYFNITTSCESGIRLEEGVYSPEFGIKQSNNVIVLRKKAIAPYTIEYSVT